MKLCALVLVMILLVSFSGCTLVLVNTSGQEKHMFNSVTYSDKEISDTVLQQLIAAISEKDEQALYQMFSPNVIRSCTDFDENVAGLLEFWKGDIVSKKRYGPGSEAKKESNVYRKDIFVSYDICTDEGSYRLAFRFCVADSMDAENMGITSLYIMKQDGSNPNRAYWGNSGEWIYGVNIE